MAAMKASKGKNKQPPTAFVKRGTSRNRRDGYGTTAQQGTVESTTGRKSGVVGGPGPNRRQARRGHGRKGVKKVSEELENGRRRKSEKQNFAAGVHGKEKSP